ncbi:MAG: DMT family transporter [Chloroflexi bacterium]|nr:DMT family transporter [Chloroflexota bacterium]
MDSGDIAALAGALGWAVAGIILKSATVRVRALKINAVFIFLTASLGLIVAAAAGQIGDVFSINRTDSALLLGGAVVGTTGDLALFRSITIGELGRNFTTATAVFVLASAFGGWLILDESVSGYMLVGGLLILLGVYLTNVPAGAFVNGLRGLVPESWHSWRDARSAPVLAIIAGLLWMASLLMIAEGIAGHDAIAANGLSNLAPLVIYAVIILAWAPARPLPMARADGVRVVVAGLLFGASILSFMFALELSDASSTAILVSSSPLFLVPLSVIFLGERLTSRATAGLALTLAGVFLVVGLG